jgi:hypothetical protein
MTRDDWVYLFRSTLTLCGWSGEQVDEMIPGDEVGCSCGRNDEALELLEEIKEDITFHVSDPTIFVDLINKIIDF